tara:strand:+ start:978 stop:1295 length:318 start_codon:yes stop_codon:yes gene_type:complete
MRILKYIILLIAIAITINMFAFAIVHFTHPIVKKQSTWVCKSVILQLHEEPVLVDSDIGDTPDLIMIAKKMNNGIPTDLYNRSHVEFNLESVMAGMAIKTICWTE